MQNELLIMSYAMGMQWLAPMKIRNWITDYGLMLLILKVYLLANDLDNSYFLKPQDSFGRFFFFFKSSESGPYHQKALSNTPEIVSNDML